MIDVTYLWKESPQEDQNVLEKAIELLLPEGKIQNFIYFSFVFFFLFFLLMTDINLCRCAHKIFTCLQSTFSTYNSR